MRKYLTQHSFNAFTIQLPQEIVFKNKTSILLKEEFLGSAKNTLLNRFVIFIQKNFDKSSKYLPSFNFLTVFYDVLITAETDEFIEFKLILNIDLNESMWMRLKHTVFNRYNALIGFSEVLEEEETLDDSNRLLIQRINENAREMFLNTKLEMEFELMKDFNFELKSALVQPYEYLSSYLNYRQSKNEGIAIDLQESNPKNRTVNIDHAFFKSSLDLFFEALNKAVNIAGTGFQVNVKQFCEIKFEFNKEAIKDDVFIQEIQSINDFFDQGINMMHFSYRMFHFLYIRLVAEKLGGSFRMDINPETNMTILAEWTFPLFKSELPKDIVSDGISSNKNTLNSSMAAKDAEIYPAELRKEIAHYFSLVNGTFVLDDWKTFADKLDVICVKYKSKNVEVLVKIAKNIRQSVDSFDVTALRQLGVKIKQISFTK